MLKCHKPLPKQPHQRHLFLMVQHVAALDPGVDPPWGISGSVGVSEGFDDLMQSKMGRRDGRMRRVEACRVFFLPCGDFLMTRNETKHRMERLELTD